MTWQGRLREGTYTSPSGFDFSFLYENVSRTVEKQTTAFTFPDANGTFVQDLGRTGRQYPMRFIFSGDNHDLEADAFELALLEPGVGVLQHPRYGRVDVVPFGKITQRDDLKSAANQTIIEVVMWDTIGLVYPLVQTDPTFETAAAVAAFNAAQADQFLDGIDDSPFGALLELRDKYNAFLDTTEDGLRVIADTQADVQRTFDNIVDSINRGIDVLIADPLTLAFQTAIMIQAPARALTSIQARLDAYLNLAQDIFTSDDNPPGTNNEFRARDLYAMSFVSGSVVSVLNATFRTRSEALAAAEAVLDQFDAAADWREPTFETLGQIDTGDAHQALQNAVALAAGFLVQISFTLDQERTITLDRDRQLIELVAELYQDISDERLNFFIDSNDLSGSEILELPAGREVVYYV